ncbi:MAG: MBL fold metallo-hydrolase [Pyrinomonadaceae bacterium]|nr:MBL fold metallo-hydrolase [Pyrinomonadaceae bacterium]
MLKNFIASSLLLSLFSNAVLAHKKHENENQTQEITVKTQKITDRVYMLQGRGGNIGVSTGADGILIVDDDYAQVSAKIAEALKALGSEKPRFIFNTHWHGDHTEGNKFFGKDSLILAHTNVRKRLSVESLVLGNKVPVYEKFALPIFTYDQSMSVHFNDEEIRAVHYPNGHTDGDSVIFFTKANVVHLGDDFFTGRFPFVDLDNGGSVSGLTKNIGEIIAKLPADVKIIPGHGALSTLADLKAYHQMLIETTDAVQKGMASGKTLEGLKKDGLPAKYKSWGEGFIKPDFWIETIYKSLSVKK